MLKDNKEKKLVVYWSRRDFRLHDNPALSEAIKYSKENDTPLLPLFILEDYMCRANTDFQFGYAQRFFLSKALPSYVEHFEQFLILKGKAATNLIEISEMFDIKIFVNEDVYTDFYKQIKKLEGESNKKSDVGSEEKNLEVFVIPDMLTVDRETRSGTGNYYSVFTPFKKAIWREFLNAKTYEKVNTKNINCIDNKDFQKIKEVFENRNNATTISKTSEKNKITQENIFSFFNENRKIKVGNITLDIDVILRDANPGNKIVAKQDLNIWSYTEEENLRNFKKYVKENISNYEADRNSLELDLTSKMSPALSWGLVSARTIKDIIMSSDIDHKDFENIFSLKAIPEKYVGATCYVSELIWREFYKYLMYRKPELMDTEFQEKFRGTIRWVDDSEAQKRFIAWIQGKTGYKVVDAAMMQLAKTGWMHNRSRMIVASILTKNLGVDWRWGQEYFRAMLIDLDEASNNGGWQWGASVGADPKPIRIFNAYLQAENYDKNNVYQKKWLSDTDFYFGPEPIIEHKLARDQAIQRYKLASGGELE